MVLVKANSDSEAGVFPGKELMDAMGQFNEELMKSGAMLAGEGLQASAKGARIRFSAGKPIVTQGPFPADGLVAGFWMIQAKSKDEVIELFKRCPGPAGNGEGEIEIRQVFEAADFPPEIMSPELAAKEQQWRDQQAKK
jgi:hypothetical protein